ncbi:MFS transporter [Pseudonocardia endophytica]|uniref:EmrB/QacA subfamily drug resistance transporter n=1 Tax=Pseudonocardia endophytica TaxID=401976 RepID=A0A4R1HVJ4_PSEEN|nr:MFS transporter [Pseudonocardia endophytica]TCK24730.1 EmrB/QacA subfamily drug resistance transporter [Pseudonocardia endophytica]
MSGGPTSAQSPPDAAEAPDPRRWRALWVTLVAGFMSLLDVSIVAVALPSLQRGLETGPSGVQWVVSGYALTFGLALVPAGRLGDAFGRRRMFLIALSTFVVCSAAVGAAPTIELLVAARLAQGLAAGMLAPQNSGLIQNLFTGAERARAFGMFGTTVGLSTASGPLVGGLILGAAGGPDGWRWIFFVNLPIGLVALILAARLIPRVPGSGLDRRDIDWTGAVLLGGAVLAVLLPLAQAESGGIRRLWWLFGVAAALGVVFTVWERRVARTGAVPLLDVRLLSSTSGYGWGTALGAVYVVGFSGVWIVTAQFFQGGLGYTPLESGLATMPFALGSAVAATWGGRLVVRYGRRLTVFGLVVVIVGFSAVALLFAVVDPSTVGIAAAPALLVAGMGGGFVLSPNLTMTLRAVPVRMAGSAGGALQTAQRVGAAIGTAGLAGLYYAFLSATGRDTQAAVAFTFLATVGTTLVALLIALVDLRRARSDVADDPHDGHISHD